MFKPVTSDSDLRLQFLQFFLVPVFPTKLVSLVSLKLDRFCRLFQLRVLRFSFFQDGDVRVGAFPEDEASQSLWEADFAHQFHVTRVGAQRIHCGVGSKFGQPEVAFLIGGVEPIEGMIPVTQIGIQLRDKVRR